MTWASPGILYDHHLGSDMFFTCWDLTWPSPAEICYDLHLGSDMTFICDLTWPSPAGIWHDTHLLGSDLTFTCWDLTWHSPAGIWHDFHLLGFDMIFTWNLTYTWWDLISSQNRNDFKTTARRTTLYPNSFIPSAVDCRKNPLEQLRNSPSISSFKRILLKTKFPTSEVPLHFLHGSRLLSVIHARLRLNCSDLKLDLFNNYV